jgi:hypothetical protein
MRSAGAHPQVRSTLTARVGPSGREHGRSCRPPPRTIRNDCHTHPSYAQGRESLPGATGADQCGSIPIRRAGLWAGSSLPQPHPRPHWETRRVELRRMSSPPTHRPGP